MRYETLNLTELELRNRSLTKVDTSEHCCMCKNKTQYIDYCSEQRICSEECMTKQNKILNDRILRKQPWIGE